MNDYDIIAIFDNGGKSIDRYTIVFATSLNADEGYDYHDMLALGDDVTSPQGFSQWCEGTYHLAGDNSHLGKQIDWSILPESHREHIKQKIA